MQEIQHKKEEEMIELLSQHFNLERASYQEDILKGIDVYIDGQPYDLKCSNSCRITVFKNYKGKIYCPLMLHQEVPYLYCVRKGGMINEVSCYLVTKAEILEYIMKRWCNLGAQLYGGDGNVNAIVPIYGLLNEEHLFKRISL